MHAQSLHAAQDVSIKSRGEAVGELAFIFRLRHLCSASVGKQIATLFALSVDDYQHLCATYVEDAGKVVEEIIQTVDSTGAAGKSQASANSASSALRSSEQAQRRVDNAIRRQTEQQVIAFIHATAAGDVRTVSRILEAGKVDVDESDHNDRTALHLAASKGHKELVRLLLECHGASHALKDCYGRLPLDDAICHGHLPVVQVRFHACLPHSGVHAHAIRPLG